MFTIPFLFELYLKYWSKSDIVYSSFKHASCQSVLSDLNGWKVPHTYTLLCNKAAGQATGQTILQTCGHSAFEVHVVQHDITIACTQ